MSDPQRGMSAKLLAYDLRKFPEWLQSKDTPEWFMQAVVMSQDLFGEDIRFDIIPHTEEHRSKWEGKIGVVVPRTLGPDRLEWLAEELLRTRQLEVVTMDPLFVERGDK